MYIYMCKSGVVLIGLVDEKVSLSIKYILIRGTPIKNS